MAFCTKCGTQTNEAVCPACGAAMETAYNQPTGTAPQQNPTAPQQPYTTQQPYGYQPPYYPQKPVEEPVSVLGWIGRFLIPCIPVVGWIIYLVMLFVWMGDNTKQESFRNWAKAQLILMAIGFGLAIVMGVLMVLFTMGVASNFAQY